MKLTSVPQTPVENFSFNAKGACGAYIAAAARRDVSFGFSVCSEYVNPDFEAVNRLNRFIHRAVATVDTNLSLVPLNCKTIKLVVFTDASIANNSDLSSQLGNILVHYENCENANILHYSSTKCERVTRSVVASELYAAVH